MIPFLVNTKDRYWYKLSHVQRSQYQLYTTTATSSDCYDMPCCSVNVTYLWWACLRAQYLCSIVLSYCCSIRDTSLGTLSFAPACVHEHCGAQNLVFARCFVVVLRTVFGHIFILGSIDTVFLEYIATLRMNATWKTDKNMRVLKFI